MIILRRCLTSTGSFIIINPILMISLLIGCTSAIYMVSVIERSPQEEPEWITHRLENEIIGIGRDRYKKRAYDQAILDLQMKIASEIGIELSFRSISKRQESDDSYSESSKTDTDIIGDAILREIHTSITGTYWEHCREQTGRNSFHDFYRFYVKANITPEMIDTLRILTVAENERRLSIIKGYLSSAESALRDDEPAHPTDGLRDYANALHIADKLFYERTLYIRKCLNGINDIIEGFRIKCVTSYNEVRPERHYLEFKVDWKSRPVEGVRIHFELTKGHGLIESSAITDDEGIVKCKVLYTRMYDSNQVTASLDLTELLDELADMKSERIRSFIRRMIGSIRSNACRDTFSSLAQRAKVLGGSLEILNVRQGSAGIFYKRVRYLDCRFFLEEINGRDVEFHSYDVSVKCWYQSLFGGEKGTDEAKGSFELSPPLRLRYNEKRSCRLPDTARIASLINEVKAAHETGMKKIKISLMLHGRDDAGNDLEVPIYTDPIPWRSLFEK